MDAGKKKKKTENELVSLHSETSGDNMFGRRKEAKSGGKLHQCHLQHRKRRAIV